MHIYSHTKLRQIILKQKHFYNKNSQKQYYLCKKLILFDINSSFHNNLL